MPRRTHFVLLVSVVVAACATAITAPEPSLEGLPEGLSVSLTVAPGQVNQHGPFTVKLDITNTTDEVIRVVTGNGCLVIPHVLRNGMRIPFKGSLWGCTAAVTTHTFPPRETRSRTWEMRAELYAEHAGDVDGVAAPKGIYRVQAEFDTVPEPGSFQKPTIEQEIRVR